MGKNDGLLLLGGLLLFVLPIMPQNDPSYNPPGALHPETKIPVATWITNKLFPPH